MHGKRGGVAGHRLAGKDSVLVADLAAEHLLQDPEAVPEWRDIAVELRDGQPPGRIPFFRTVEEKLEHVAAGHGIVVLPLSTATFYTRTKIRKLDEATTDADVIVAAALRVLDLFELDRPVRLLGVRLELQMPG